jgi:hypothetical protein
MGVLSGQRFRLAFALFWTLASTLMLLGISVAIFRQPGFPLDLGLIRTSGRSGLWVTLLPGGLGLVAVLLLFWQRRVGAGLLAAYSLFWLVIFAGGLHAVWNAKRSFCIESLDFCIVTPWIGRLTTIGLAVPFLLVAVWSGRQAARGDLLRH